MAPPSACGGASDRHSGRALLDLLRLEAVVQALGRVEVADFLVVKVRELADIEDDWNFFRLLMKSPWWKGTMIGFLRVVE